VSTLMIDIIPHDDMVRGQSLFSGIVSAINMVGTAFSGMLVAFFGVPLIVIFNGLSNLYSAASELFIHVPKTVQQGQSVSVKSLARDMKDAMKMIFSDSCLRLFVPCALLLNLLGAGPLTLTLPFILEKGFAVDMYGYLMAVFTVGSLLCVLLLGVVKLKPRARFWVMAIGFCGAVPAFVLAYCARQFVFVCILASLASFLNCGGNTVFNASLVLALPEENRGAILGFFQSASVGGSALSALIYGFLGDVFPLYLVFTVGSVLTAIPMIYMCINPKTREFVLSH
jgi:MFS family permease